MSEHYPNKAVENMFRSRSVEQLISALKCPDEQVCAKAEIHRRIKSNLATHLAVRYLTGERDDAFDGLVALCWKAKGNLYVPPMVSEEAHENSIHQCTREFIEDFVLQYFDPYTGRDESEILKAALADKFRYIGRRLHSRMIDVIRKRTASKNKELETVRLDDVDEDSLAAGIDGKWYGSEARLEPSNSNMYFEFLEPRRERLSNTLGKLGCEVLHCCFEIYPDGYLGTPRQCESALTRAIQRHRRVSEQQARNDKRQFREAVRSELKRDNKDLHEIYSRIDKGDDDHTLRVEWITAKGHKGSFKLPFSLSFGRENPERDSVRG
ncbi:MAG TPA: hypothetical protein VNE63_11260 [Candidatus Acidoferrales bacterium]|nr:hypothetical protein [Candidatus Acidoferrales bacterium]